MTFELTERQILKLEKWVKEQDENAWELQQLGPHKDQTYHDAESNTYYPYAGAVGGSITFMFTPTSLGYVVQAQHGLTKETIDLTSYEDW